MVLKTCEIPGFTESIDLHELDVGEELSSATNQLRRHGRSAVGQHLESAQIMLPRVGKLRQQINHRRDQDRGRHAMLFYRVAEGCRREAWQRVSWHPPNIGVAKIAGKSAMWKIG